MSNFGSRCETALGTDRGDYRCVDLHGIAHTGGHGAVWVRGREIRGLAVPEGVDSGGVAASLGLEDLAVTRLVAKRLVTDDGTSPRDALDAARPVRVNRGLAHRLIDSIHLQNEEELHGRMAKAVLKMLRRTFPAAGSYVFELLQNASDEGATRVSFAIDEEAEELVFQHNGRPLSVADVLGLSLVAHSGKQGRTIGFMGVGFKAVYKRFDRARIVDDLWAFEFKRVGADDHWKVLPTWSGATAPPDDGFTCRFTFGAPVGGIGEVREDLSNVPPEAAALLGRRALARSQDGAVWTLHLPESEVAVRRHRLPGVWTGSTQSSTERSATGSSPVGPFTLVKTG